MQATPNQMSILYRFTGLKFWEPEQIPPPTVQEASPLISVLFNWSKSQSEEDKTTIIKLVRQFFPDWTGDSLHKAWLKKKWTGGRKPERTERPAQPEPAQPEPATPEDLPAPETPREAATAANGAAENHDDETVSAIVKLIKCGIENIWLSGPAGCGKTWSCMETAKICNLPITILSCSAGTSARDFTGRVIPTVEPSPVSAAIGLAGIIVLDEITMLDPSVAAVANSLLANKIVQTSHGAIERKCIIIATSNTLGTGADRLYIGNNQLDAATLDRFCGGRIQVDYSTKYEGCNYNKEICRYVWKMRETIQAHNLRRIASTRAIIAAAKIHAYGGNWKAAITQDWTAEEKELLS